MSRTTTIGLALLVVGIITGAAVAHAVPPVERIGVLGTSLFAVDAGETAHFNVTLLDGRGGASARVLLHLVDRAGTIVAQRDVTLAPGQSATLRYSQPGTLRAQARIIEPDTSLGDQRLVLSTVEIFGSGESRSLDLELTSHRRFVCSAGSDDGAGSGRLPDAH